MAQQFSGRVMVCALAAVTAAACTLTPADVQRHAEKLDALHATVVVVVDGWLAGDVSGRSAAATLERTFSLAAQERAAVSHTPQDLANPAANTVAHRSEELLRLIAALSDALAKRDDGSARRLLHEGTQGARFP